MPIDPGTTLRKLSPHAKARRLLDMLPIIETKINEGVSHREIIRALSEQGLELSKNTYFSYLRRFRKRGAAVAAGTQSARLAVSPSMTGLQQPVPNAARDTGENAARRPPTFDYDPHGIPDLLK